MRKCVWIALLACGLIAMLVACGRQDVVPSTPPSPAFTPSALPQGTAAVAASQPRVLRIGASTFPDVIDPQKSSVVTEINVLQLAYEGLVRLDEKGNVQPASADTWRTSPDGKTITFHIRDGLQRWDGTPLACADFEYALRREVDPYTAGKLYTSIITDIKGARALLDYGDQTEVGKLDRTRVDALYTDYGVHCADERTLEVELDSPIGFWEYVASTWITYPTDRRAVERDPDAWSTHPENHVGNGPFRITRIEEGKRIILEANPRYWGGRPKLDRIEFIYSTDNTALFEAFKKGELELVSVIPQWLPEIQVDPGLQATLLRYPAASTFMFAFNQSRKPFDDKNVRVAFSELLDREGYSRDVNLGTTEPYTRWIPPGVPGAQPDKTGVPETNYLDALLLLARSGYAAADSTPAKPKVDCARLGELKLTYEARPVEQVRATFVASNITRVIGCPVVLDPVDATVYSSMEKDVKTAPSLSRQGWIQDYPHPQNWLSVYWVCGSFSARYGYCNPELDRLLHEADQTTDFEQAIRKYQAAEDLLLSDVPGAMAYYAQHMYLIAPYVVGPQEHISSQDGVWPGTNGPVIEYDIDLSQVPANYPRQ